jgi:AcrR family transcriptional regulator
MLGSLQARETGIHTKRLTVTIVTCNVRYMSERKDELITAAKLYLLRNGVADLSLRPMAKALRTSARLLLFHFESKEKLLQCVLDSLQRDVQVSFVQSIDATRHAHQSVMKSFWLWATHPKNLPSLRLLYEVNFIAIQNPRVFSRYLANSSLNWRDVIQQALPTPLRSERFATLCGAVFDGLLIELISSGDVKRTTKALDTFVSMLRREHKERSRAAVESVSGRKTQDRGGRL